jgi:hypothetical protein
MKENISSWRMEVPVLRACSAEGTLRSELALVPAPARLIDRAYQFIHAID